MLSPLSAYAAGNEVKEVDIPGVGHVYYILNPTGVETGAGEWDHVHGTVPGKGTQDFRVNLYGNQSFAYWVEAYPSLPIEDSQTDGKYVAEAAVGGIPGTLYGTASMTHLEFWMGEGVSVLTDSSSPNKDNEGYYDLGGFDTVTRSTLTYGLGHTAYSYQNIIYGFDRTTFEPMTPYVANFTAVNFSGNGYATTDGLYFALGEKAAPATGGHETTDTFFLGADADTAAAYFLEKYTVPGFKAVPVKVDGVTFIENRILADAGLLDPSLSAFKNVTIGGTLNLIWNEQETGTASASTPIPVTENTGLLKELGANGLYGPMAPGKSEMSYEVQSGGGWATISHDYNYTWGDYTDAYVTLQKAGSVKTTNDLTEEEYFNYCFNFLTAKYEYFGDIDELGLASPSEIPDLAALEARGLTPKAAYGSTYIVDTWWAPYKKARIEVGFNFDALRMGGTGISTTQNGVYNYGNAMDKTGFYRVTLYSIGHNNVQKLIYVKTQLPKPSLSLTEDLKKLTLGDLNENLKTMIASGAASVKLSSVSGRTVTDIGTITGLASDNSYDVSALGLTAGTTYRLTIAGGETTTPVTVDITPVVAESISNLSTTNVTTADAITLPYGGADTLRATLAPANANIGATVTWTSSNPNVVRVDAAGKITAVAVGTAKITAALPNGAKAESTVTVSPVNIANASIGVIADQTYTGAEIKPAVTVTYGQVTLTEGTDYSVTFSNNTQVGTATLMVLGKGNFTGSKPASFTIVAASTGSSGDTTGSTGGTDTTGTTGTSGTTGSTGTSGATGAVSTNSSPTTNNATTVSVPNTSATDGDATISESAVQVPLASRTAAEYASSTGADAVSTVAEESDASEDGTKSGTPLVLIGILAGALILAGAIWLLKYKGLLFTAK
jgi:uncharacterized protein YjdB